MPTSSNSRADFTGHSVTTNLCLKISRSFRVVIGSPYTIVVFSMPIGNVKLPHIAFICASDLRKIEIFSMRTKVAPTLAPYFEEHLIFPVVDKNNANIALRSFSGG